MLVEIRDCVHVDTITCARQKYLQQSVCWVGEYVGLCFSDAKLYEEKKVKTKTIALTSYFFKKTTVLRSKEGEGMILAEGDLQRGCAKRTRILAT